eukprot:scaffold70197_cov59-Phaeocystis_antarctica.AAC.1
MAQDCARSCSGRTATAPLGMPSGKNEHHPGWKPLQGSASDRIPGWAPSPCRLPGPILTVRASSKERARRAR